MRWRNWRRSWLGLRLCEVVCPRSVWGWEAVFQNRGEYIPVAPSLRPSPKLTLVVRLDLQFRSKKEKESARVFDRTHRPN
jgi:hypothetical protein